MDTQVKICHINDQQSKNKVHQYSKVVYAAILKIFLCFNLKILKPHKTQTNQKKSEMNPTLHLSLLSVRGRAQ